MKLEAGTRILAVAGLCAAALIGLVVSEGFAREGGQEITLPMAAVDPRAILSGHYTANGIGQHHVAGLGGVDDGVRQNGGHMRALRYRKTYCADYLIKIQ